MVDFPSPIWTGVQVTDKNGVSWDVFAGTKDADEEHYGFFDGKSLIARLSLVSPSLSSADCATPYWSIGMIEILNTFQNRGLGPRLLDSVFALRGAPLASDLDQAGGGADLWRRWIRDYPGEIELHGPSGRPVNVVVKSDSGYAPDPWKHRATRLVRISSGERA